MLIVASIYLVLIWLIFFKLELLPWNRYWGSLVMARAVQFSSSHRICPSSHRICHCMIWV